MEILGNGDAELGPTQQGRTRLRALHGLLYRGLPAGVGTESEPLLPISSTGWAFPSTCIRCPRLATFELMGTSPGEGQPGNVGDCEFALIAILYVANFARAGLDRFGIWNSCRCAWNNRFASRFGPCLSGASHTVQAEQAPETSVYEQQRRFRAAFVDSSTCKADGEGDFGQLRPSF